MLPGFLFGRECQEVRAERWLMSEPCPPGMAPREPLDSGRGQPRAPLSHVASCQPASRMVRVAALPFQLEGEGWVVALSWEAGGGKGKTSHPL